MQDCSNVNFIEHLEKIHMDISEAKEVSLDSNWKCNNACAVFTRIYMIEEGYGEIFYDGKTISLLPGNIYIIPAGLEFSYSCDKYLKKMYFHVSVLLPNCQELFTQCKHCIVLQHQTKQIENIRRKLSENKPSSVLHVKIVLEQLILQCIMTIEGLNEEMVYYSETVLKAQEYIGANLSAKLTVTQVADAMFLSPSKLQKLFRKELNISVGSYIDKRLMYFAEREVRRGECSLGELSNMLGFCDQFYFSRRFSETYGMSPLRYRKQFVF